MCDRNAPGCMGWANRRGTPCVQPAIYIRIDPEGPLAGMRLLLCGHHQDADQDRLAPYVPEPELTALSEGWLELMLEAEAEYVKELRGLHLLTLDRAMQSNGRIGRLIEEFTRRSGA